MNRAVRSQRQVARTILGVLVALLTAFLLFAGGPSAMMSLAQEPTTRFEIQFLNPSAYSDQQEVSTKDDDSASESEDTYHLTAWVNELPANHRVEFRYVDPDSEDEREETIGEAVQNGDDAFEFFWDPDDDLPEGDITLIAVLFSGETEVARDTEADTFLNDKSQSQDNPDDDDPRGETVEMTYPENGGSLGFHTPRDGSTAAILRVTWSKGEGGGAGGDGTSHILPFYTTTPPGEEPDWDGCGADYLFFGEGDDGVRCTLSAGTEPHEVTGVAVLSNDQPTDPILGIIDPEFDDSGDAHRVLPYEQVPTTVELEPDVQNEVPDDECSDAFTIAVLDQLEVPVASAPVDMHAQGPSDDLAFDSDHVAPQTGGHDDEDAVDCSDPPTPAGEQGELELVTDPDIKHVEGSTDDLGEYPFQLFSPDDGGTQVTVWADQDEDDQFCASEPSASGSAGWRESAPDVSGLPPDEQDCPLPTPSTSSPIPTTSSPGPTDDPRGCTISGDAQDNVLEGTAGDDVICANGGNDTVRGLGGDDVIYGDAGEDDLRGAGGKDRLVGGAGRDTLRGSNGNDRQFGGGDSDTSVGGKGKDRLYGGGAFDTLRGGIGNDRVVGAGGNDLLAGAGGNDSLRGGTGSDVLRGGKGRDRCRPGPGRDQVTGCER